MTTSVSNNTISQSLLDTMNPQSTSSTDSTVSDQENQFLTLLVTQMQNQDPTDPMDNSEVTSQMAQLATVTGIDQLNTTMQSMVTSNQTSQSLQAANLIGQGVLAPGSSVNLSSSQGVFGVTLPQDVDDATVTISDSSGNTVASLDLGAQKAGTIPLSWDGAETDGSTAPDGTYTVSVKATVGTTSVTATPLQYGTVTSITTTAGQDATLNVSGLGAVNYSDVQEIL